MSCHKVIELEEGLVRAPIYSWSVSSTGDNLGPATGFRRVALWDGALHLWDPMLTSGGQCLDFMES